MKRLLVFAMLLIAIKMNAQSLRIDPLIFGAEIQNTQFGTVSTSSSTPIPYIDQTAATGSGFAMETTNKTPEFAISGNGDNTATNIVVQEDLVAGKKGEELNIFIKFYRKLFTDRTKDVPLISPK